MRICWIATICCLCLLTNEVIGGRFWKRKPRIRVRIRLPKPVCKALCKGACSVVVNWIKCPICVIGCPPVCKKICKKRRKRREESDVVMYPCSFAEYDKNKDGVISREEFMNTLDFLSPEDLERIFKTIDQNEDDLIDEDEFNAVISKLNPTNCFHDEEKATTTLNLNGL